MASLLTGCDEGPKKMGIEKLVAVQSNSGSRVFVVYKDKNGLYYYRSIYHAKKVTDGNVTIDPHDYLANYGGNSPYGPLPGCEEDFQAYKAQRNASP
jgi:hypothetical protein